MAHKQLRNGLQARAPFKWGEGAKNPTASRHHGCPTSVPERPQKLNVGTWNVRTMNEKGKLENIKQEMKTLKINVLGLSEVRWKGVGDFVSDDFRIIYSGGKEGREVWLYCWLSRN